MAEGVSPNSGAVLARMGNHSRRSERSLPSRGKGHACTSYGTEDTLRSGEPVISHSSVQPPDAVPASPSQTDAPASRADASTSG